MAESRLSEPMPFVFFPKRNMGGVPRPLHILLRVIFLWGPNWLWKTCDINEIKIRFDTRKYV